MVTYIRSDLDFILEQIKVSEAHAAGQPLYGPGGLVPAYNLSMGLRTVDGTYNNLINPNWGSADQPFPEHLGTIWRPADGTPVDFDGPGPAPAMPTQSTYAPSDNPNSIVVDSSLRTISNLIVDQTLNNPAAVMTALQIAGEIPGGQQLAFAATIVSTYQPLIPLFKAVDDAADAAAEAAAAAAAANPPDPVLDQAALDAAAALSAAEATLAGARGPLDALLTQGGITLDGANVHIPNAAPDEGLSASFNSWFTLFGQFFDHGLDLVGKGGSGTVFIPLAPDDPLFDPTPGAPNFMVLTRATVTAGNDGVMGTADDVRPTNTTTAFVDQNQTYSSHPSHQVFLREYAMNGAGDPVATGELIQGSAGGMATWADLKAQAATMLGIQLVDGDVGNVPLLATDPYGQFIRGANGFPQIVTTTGLVEGNPAANGGLGIELPANTIFTGHAFLADIAHNAVPDGLADGDIEIGLGNQDGSPATDAEYDNELLDAHFVAGDGRANENVGLTAVHHVFHSEHNRLVEHTKSVVLADAQAMLAGGASQVDAVAFLNEWLADDVAAVPTNATGLIWDGERLFQAAKFGTEMQYQHLVFEEFARKIQPQINVFLVPDGFDVTIDPSIVAEFAHVVYRFGHSMLTESIDRFDPTFTPDHIGLIEGFLNPLQFQNNGTDGTVDADIAAGAIVRGMTRQVGNEIDEFVTSALRNNLLGLPLDLATINLARGRDTGVPTLNEARRQFYDATNQDALLKPYESWVDFAGHLKHEASIINFIAAYGTHASITGATTLQDKRDAAMALVTGVTVGAFAPPADRLDFLNATGAYAGGTLGGLENIDLWIGGLAEQIMPFGGMLGSTFNFVFEIQMEKLQSGDRFYYLQRLDGLHLFGEMENNSFASLIMRNTDAVHLPSDVFSTPSFILEVNKAQQFNPDTGIFLAGDDGVLGTADDVMDTNADPLGTSILTPLVIRNNPGTPGADTNYLRYTGGDHVVLGGTEGADILVAGIGDDTLYGDGGNDVLEGGFGNDIINGGAGDDIIKDSGGDDNIKAGDGNDVVHAGPGLDLVMGGAGQDFIFLGTDAGSEVFAGEGNDFIYGNKNAERILGNGGNDWIETGTFDGAPGDNFDEIFARDALDGHDVFLGDGGFDEFIGEGGDDIMVGSPGRGKMAGMSGWDWATYKDSTFGVDADLTRAIVFDENPTPPIQGTLDAYEAIEGLSGSAFDDILGGSNILAEERLPFAQGGTEGYAGSELDATSIALVNGLSGVLGAGVVAYSAGDIILGGDGNDTIIGRAGDDIIDGDKWLNVRISVRSATDPNVEIASYKSMTQLATQMFNGQINPGQLQIVREILSDTTTGDIDTAVFSGNLDEYTFGTDAFGRMTVSHTGGTQEDGTDTITNIERLQFADQFVSLLNDPATGAPNISDMTPTEGSVLTATVGTIADANGFVPASVTYQWQMNDGVNFVNIAGATNATFTPQQAQVNRPLRVVASFTDLNGFAEQVFSAATIVVGDLFAGTAGVDNVTGTDGQDNLSGLASNDILNGGAENDILNGGTGNDTLDGGTGNDAMTGGADNDTYVVDSVGDVVTELAGGGTDTVQTSLATYTLANNLENLTKIGAGNFTGTGNAVANIIIGGIANNTLNGLAGNDTLDGQGGNDTLNGGDGNDILNGGVGVDTLNGGNDNDTLDGGAGNDGMAGGTGNDIYVVDAAGDVVIENAGGGTDTVQTNLTAYTLGAQVENLTKTGAGVFTGIGNALANIIIGGSGNNILNGLAGDDRIDGGLGNDTMAGGTENDTYVVDAVGDVVTEAAGAGTDTVETALATYTLGANVENLLRTAAGTGNGNTLANTLTGSAGADILNGLGANDILNGGGGNDRLDGGIGNDTMAGGADNDTYVVDAAADVVTEGAGAGTDTVETALATYTLGANVENLVRTGAGNGTGTGNGLANTMTGGTGTDTLNGLDGNDTFMALNADGNDSYGGGTGTDTLNMSAVTTSVTVNFNTSQVTGGAGTDTLNSIEAAVGGTAADTFIAGAGVNTVTGGAGNDTFRFDSNAVTNNDVITDFQAGDRIDLSLIDANSVTGGNGAFTLLLQGNVTFGGQQATLRTYVQGGNTIIEGNNDGDAAADFSITLSGNVTLTLGGSFIA